MKRFRERPRPSRRTFVKGLAVGGAVASLGYWDPLYGRRLPTQGAGRPQRHRLRSPHRRDADEPHRRPADGADHQRHHSGADAALARGRHRHAAGGQRARRGRIDSLARHLAARQHGRRSGPEFRRHSSGRDISHTASTCGRAGPTGTTATRDSRSSAASTGRSSSSRASPSRSATTASTSCMLSDWTDENPERVFAKLKKQSDYYNFRQRTVGDFVRDVRERGLRRTAGRAQRRGARCE